MSTVHAGKRPEVRTVFFFSDLVLNAQLLERINDRYSKNWALASWFFVQVVRQMRHLGT